MATYVILSRIGHDSFDDPKGFKAVAATVSQTIKERCPDVKWKNSYATTGRFDVVDIVEAPSLEQVERAAMIIRAYGRATTETLVATPWQQFLENL